MVTDPFGFVRIIFVVYGNTVSSQKVLVREGLGNILEFHKYPLIPPILRRGAGAKICSRNNVFKNHEAQHAKNTFENRLSTPLRFI